MKVYHTLEPIYNSESKVLILGTMPSIKSREIGFYYMHPNNRFWGTLEKVYDEKIGNSIEDKKYFILKHKIALFDVLKSCDIDSSSDSSIKKPIPNNINKILKETNIKVIFTTGKKAYELYNKYLLPKTKIEAICLPSTSPANCKKGIEEILYKEYNKIKEYTD